MTKAEIKLFAYTSVNGKNPLSKYVPCKVFAKSRKGKNKNGREFLSVTTTKEFMEIMDWVEDNKYIVED